MFLIEAIAAEGCSLGSMPTPVAVYFRVMGVKQCHVFAFARRSLRYCSVWVC